MVWSRHFYQSRWGSQALTSGIGYSAVLWFIRGVIIIAALSIVLRAVLPDDEEDLLNAAVLMDPVNWVAEWIGTNFERVLESEPSEAVKDTIDSSEML